ncbi:hypothetical protein AWW66_25250 [Micromonospora rosaria]|uniref:Uncharacterized protein n=1 Tax=Micromonospora rosaria TaxID=47874 RepID=A0A136PLA9_9ACTN|nr:hypothetical protein [Micromonospora rosaria]KXK59260.1 hypothetical protein AWW66_25250 [Micromonospora rosaria]
MTDKDQTLFNEPGRAYEALGRIMHALRESHALNGAHSLDWWPALGGRSWEIEWQSGPFAPEAAEQVLRVDHDDDPAAPALRGVVRPGAVGNQHRAYLYVLDMPVTLRALTPVGANEWTRALSVGSHP